MGRCVWDDLVHGYKRRSQLVLWRLVTASFLIPLHRAVFRTFANRLDGLTVFHHGSVEEAN